MSCNMSSRSALEGLRSRGLGGGMALRYLTYAIICTSLANNNFIFCNNVHAIKSPRSFIGRRRVSGTTSNKHDNEEGFTLGELDQMMQSNKDTSILLDPAILLASDTSNQPQQQHQAQIDEEESNNTNHQLRRRLGKINLDLSGRIMCHLLSPQDDDTSISNQLHNKKESSIPLFTIPATQSKHRKIQKFIPNVYIGANYDLDEIWYGATRYIARCSWRLPSSLSKSSFEVDGLDSSSISTSSTRNHVVLESFNNLYRKIFPTSAEPSSSMKTNWMIDVEGEQSVFDKSDTTTRLCLMQSPSPLISPATTTSTNNRRRQTSQQVSVEYDSAKYTTDHNSQTSIPKGYLQYAPTISLNIQTPFITNRLHLNTKRTWIVSNSGDDAGNYYKGNYYGDSTNSVMRRLDSIKEGYRRCIPQSHSAPTTATDASSSLSSQKKNLFNKLSKWLENDGWVPNKVTTDLMGNLHSINEVGFGRLEHTEPVEDRDIKKQLRQFSSSIIPPHHNTGIRLHISKRIDWKTLPIFPWSNRNVNNNMNNDQGSGMMDALQSTHLQLELCGIDKSGMKVTSIGMNADLLDWKDTFRITLGQESVADVSV